MIKDIALVLLKSDIFWTIVFLAIVATISLIVKKTKTQKDDAIWAMVCNSFNIAEKVIPDNTGPLWLQKIDAALKTFENDYRSRYGSLPPPDIKQFAKDQWAKLALELKKK